MQKPGLMGRSVMWSAAAGHGVRNSPSVSFSTPLQDRYSGGDETQTSMDAAHSCLLCIVVCSAQNAHTEGIDTSSSRKVLPNLTRQEVKALLNAGKTPFGERCCSEGYKEFSILVRVGHERVPWFCSDWPIYVLFEFENRRSKAPLGSAPDDVLAEIHLGSNGDGCL